MTILIFIISLALLILVHEFGHFFAAKRFGVRVDEFGFGFPPRMLGKKRGETVYSFNWIPFGGFVKIFGEEGEAGDDPASFSYKSVGSRAWIVSAGVLMNIVAAILLLSFGNIIGLPTLIGEETPAGAREVAIRILEVKPGSPADLAHFQIGDEILNVVSPEGVITISKVGEFQSSMHALGGKEIKVAVQRSGRVEEIEVTPRQNPPAGEGPLGIVLGRTAIVSYPWYEALWRGIKDTYAIAWQTAYGLGSVISNLFAKGKMVAEILGPVGIITLGSSFVGLGASYLIHFVALISINLAILNLLPFPALDGGRLLFLGLEKLRGKSIKRETEALVHRIGFAFLLALIVLVTFRDISRFF